MSDTGQIPAGRRLVLVLVRNRKRLADLILLATETTKLCQGEFRFILSPKLDAEDAAAVRKAGFELHFFPTQPSGGSLRAALRKRVRKAWERAEKSLCAVSSVAQVAFERARLRRLRNFTQAAEALFDLLRPSAVISVKDKTNDFDGPLLRVARDRAIPIVVPHIFISHLEGLETFFDDPEKGFPALHPRSTRYTKETFRRFAGQLYHGRLFYPPHITRAYASFGCLSDYPWLVGRGLSDIVCVDNGHTAQFYMRHGVPTEKIKIVGDLSNDPLYVAKLSRGEVRANLLQAHSEGTKLAIIAVPQVVEIGLLPANRHFKILGDLIAALRSRGFFPLLSLHPKMDRAAYLSFASGCGASVAEERLFRLLPAADVFLAWFSSTVAWAVLCGVPTVLLDLYPERYPCFEYLETLLTATSTTMASELASQVVESPPDFRNDWKALSREQVFDGGTFRRYAELLFPPTRAG